MIDAISGESDWLGEAEVIKLCAADRDRLLAALDNASTKPSAALLRAARRYKAAMGLPSAAGIR
jgi:uncharacterized protein (DUF1778 family)